MSAIEPVSRGFYRLTSAVPLGNPDLVAVAVRVPEGVLCLISALAFHELTTQIPMRSIWRSAAERNRPGEHPPVRVIWFSGNAFSEGIETRQMDGVPVRVYGREKTIADCFRYRNKIGLDTCLKALRLYKQQRKLNVEALLHYGQLRRVTSVLRPYLEALLS